MKIIGSTKRGSGKFEKTDYISVLSSSLAGGKDKLLQINSKDVEVG
jgi:hypothetical protein